jgi:malonyl-ACP decarboxylase
MGLVCSIAENVAEFEKALRGGRCGVSRLEAPTSQAVTVGAVVRDFHWEKSRERYFLESPDILKRARKVLNNNTSSTLLSVSAAVEAYHDAQLGDGTVSLDDTCLIVAGSNLDQQYIAHNWARIRDRQLVNPKYAINFMDSNQLGSLSEILSIRGAGLTIGAASASGNAALFNAYQWIRCGVSTRCLVVGASSDWSELELEAFALLGAASSQSDPLRACRPFDRGHDGFVWGQASACVVLESMGSARRRGARVLGEIAGASLFLDGRYHPGPSIDGELRAMRSALDAAHLPVDRIGYINAHGTSSPLGDRVECEAMGHFLEDKVGDVPINSTKSLVGHCLSAAGVVELVSTIVQLNGGFLHPNRNLEQPIDPRLNFVRARSRPLAAEYAISNGFGFGGINSSLLLRGGSNA